MEHQYKLTAPFEEWVQFSLDHPPKEPEWYWGADFDSFWGSLRMSDAATVEYLTRLFLEPRHLKPYSLEQIAQGIWFLIGDSSPSKAMYALLEVSVDVEKRIACIRAMSEFFRNFVSPATDGDAETDSDPFDMACYMWWDIVPLRPWRGKALEGEPEIHDACVTVMAEVLELPSDVCRLSALHGLNHWQEHYTEHVERVIDAFFRSPEEVTPRVREYATKARAGLCE
jgi:hypothetical protein